RVGRNVGRERVAGGFEGERLHRYSAVQRRGARRPTWLHWFRENFQATGRRRLRSEGSGLGRTALRGEAGMKTGSKAPEQFRPSRTNIFAEGPGAWRLGACLGF